MDEFFPEEVEQRKLWKLLAPFLLLGFRKGINQAETMTGKVKEDDILTQGVHAFINAQSFEKAALITGYTKELLKEELAKALKEGHSVQQFAKTIRDVYGGMERPRSLAIARTELTSSVNDGLFKTLSHEGHPQKEWSTVLDGRERESHASANGQVVPIDQPFQLAGGSGMYPGDPNLPPDESIQCRCSLVIPQIPEDRKRKLYDRFLRLHGTLEKRLVVSLRRNFRDQRDAILSQFPS